MHRLFHSSEQLETLGILNTENPNQIFHNNSKLILSSQNTINVNCREQLRFTLTIISGPSNTMVFFAL